MLFLRPQIFFAQRKRQHLPTDNKNWQQYAERLRHHGGQGGALSSHMKYRHKNQISDNVKDAGDSDCDQRHFRVPDSPEHTAQNIIRHNEGRPGKADP